MKDSNLVSQVQSLSYREKLDLLLLLATELRKDEEVINEEAYLAQLRNSNQAAHQLMTLLESEKELQNV
jgi:hypothetical protein